MREQKNTINKYHERHPYDTSSQKQTNHKKPKINNKQHEPGKTYNIDIKNNLNDNFKYQQHVA